MNKKLLKQIKDQDIETSIRQGLMDEEKQSLPTYSNKGRIEYLKKRQEELDNEILKCPECKKDTDWSWIKDYGECGDCVNKGFNQLVKCPKCGKAYYVKKKDIKVKTKCSYCENWVVLIKHNPKKQ